MKILIVDDEELARTRLKRMLFTLHYEDIAEAQNAEEALQIIKSSHFELVFLDINMPQVSGLELGYEIRYLQENIKIIFQTAYEEHALKAYDIGAVGYLVKPYSLEQLQKSIQRVEVSKTQPKDFRIMSKIGDNHFLLKPEDIFYVKADLSEVMLRSVKDFSYYGQKISELYKNLAEHNFVQIHRSYLININKIKEIQTLEQSRLRFSFHGINDEVESSKDGAKAFRERFSPIN